MHVQRKNQNGTILRRKLDPRVAELVKQTADVLDLNKKLDSPVTPQKLKSIQGTQAAMLRFYARQLPSNPTLESDGEQLEFEFSKI